MKKIYLPLKKSERRKLKTGEKLFLCGSVFTARDAAHKRLSELIKRNKKIPIQLKDQIIYYSGPTPAPPGRPSGSAGPTTSSRMDAFTLPLLKKGLAGMIGKGNRSSSVKKAIKRYRAVYFITTGGAGAFLSKRIKSSKPVCFKELGPEAVCKIELKDFPVIVAIDSKGRNIYERRRQGK